MVDHEFDKGLPIVIRYGLRRGEEFFILNDVASAQNLLLKVFWPQILGPWG